MKRRILAALLAVAMIFSICTIVYADSQDFNEYGFNLEAVGAERYEPASLVGDVYEIENVGQMYWFAYQANNVNAGINGKLLADIDMTEGIPDGLVWSPIRVSQFFNNGTWITDYGYTGTFDGNGYTLSNLTNLEEINVSRSGGLFGTVSGTVKNLTIDTFNMRLSFDSRIAAIAGQVVTGGTVKDCMVVNADVDDSVVGAAIGANYGGTAENILVLDSKLTGARSGMIVGDNINDSNDLAGNIVNSYTDGNALVSDHTGNVDQLSAANISDAALASGEVAFKLNAGREEAVWGQEIGVDSVPVIGGMKLYDIGSGQYANDPDATPRPEPTPIPEPGVNPTITKVRLYPVGGDISTLAGVKIEGSKSSPTNDFVTLATAPENPTGEFVELTIAVPGVYRYVKMLGVPGTSAKVAEIEFYAGEIKATGTAFGTTSLSGHEPDKAFDGLLDTYYEADSVQNNYVGLDFGGEMRVSQPTFSIQPGRYNEAINVGINCSTVGATIYYTTDGSIPSKTNGSVYSEPINVPDPSAMLIRAIAYVDGMTDSFVASGMFSVNMDAAEITGLRTYSFGNSLTDTFTNGMLQNITDSAGYDSEVFRHSIPGAPTDWIYSHPNDGNGNPWGNPQRKPVPGGWNESTPYDSVTAFEYLAPLDILTTQPFPNHGRLVSNEKQHAKIFYDETLKYSPNARYLVYGQWPVRDYYQMGDGGRITDSYSSGAALKHEYPNMVIPEATDWDSAMDNQYLFYEKLADEMSKEYPDKDPICVIPAGKVLQAFKNAVLAGQIPGMSAADETAAINMMYAEGNDTIHLNELGQYLASLAVYTEFYRISPVYDVTYRPNGVTKDGADAIMQLVWDVCSGYEYSSVYSGRPYEPVPEPTPTPEVTPTVQPTAQPTQEPTATPDIPDEPTDEPSSGAIFEEDFEDGVSSLTNNNGNAPFEVVDNPLGEGKVLKTSGSDEQFTTSYFLDGVDANDEYTVAFRMVGDCGHLVIGDFTESWQQFAEVETRGAYDFGWTIVNTDWKWHVVKISGKTRYNFIGQVQNAPAAQMGHEIYFDDIKVYAGDVVDEVLAELNGSTEPTATPDVPDEPTAGPTEEPTVEPTAGPTDVPTDVPTTDPGETPTPVVDELQKAKDEAKAAIDALVVMGDYDEIAQVLLQACIDEAKAVTDACTNVGAVKATFIVYKLAIEELKVAIESLGEENDAVTKVKFVKKSVKVKVGKKATLKVKLTPAKGLSKAAKKVKWSIDKKGKKVVKFVKKAKKLNGKLSAQIKAVKKGTAKITCTAPSGKKAVCKITVK